MSPPDSRKRLFTPGPLNVSPEVRKAMDRDLGSRDPEFLEVVAQIRSRLVGEVGSNSATPYEAVPMQGSGTFGLESALTSLVPRRSSRLLAIANGEYGRRIERIARRLGIETTLVETPENAPWSTDSVTAAIDADPTITHLAAVHCETSTGAVNPIEELGVRNRDWGKVFLVDGMSSLGGVPLDFSGADIDCLVSSSNKCFQGVPGFSFALVKRQHLEANRGVAGSLSLDLVDQWETLEKTGQFRFTPPTHVFLAFRQALEEYRIEGGVEGRYRRYRTNQEILRSGMERLGFRPFLRRSFQGPIITSFHYLCDPKFDFEELYRRLSDRSCVLYPGKVSEAETFRIGNIGHLFPEDMQALLEAVGTVLEEMSLPIPMA